MVHKGGTKKADPKPQAAKRAAQIVESEPAKKLNTTTATFHSTEAKSFQSTPSNPPTMAAAAGEEAVEKMKLKLLVDKKANKVIFAECGNDFVDFLFKLLSLPLSGIIAIISKESMVGSLGNIYQSLEDLKPSCFNPIWDRDSILRPVLRANSPLLLPHSSASAAGGSYLRISPEGSGGGLVKEQATFMVMDDLKVNELSMISGITLLNKFGCKDLGALEEKEVEFGCNEAMELLKASLQSTQVLTNVYLV